MTEWLSEAAEQTPQVKGGLSVMWTTLALMSALNWAPAQTEQLETKNVRFTYGMLGQERKDSSYLPGDMVVLAFDVEGLKVASDGQVRYSLGLTLTNKKGEVKFGRDPQEMVTVNTLGGSRLPVFARGEIGHDTPPGEYTMTVIVTDMATKEKKSVKLTRPFEVKRTQLGIIRTGFVYNDMSEAGGGRPQLAPPLAVPGQNLVLHFAAVGFELKGDKQQPNLAVKMEVKDDKGNSILKPFMGTVSDISESEKKLHFAPLYFPIQLNRSGKYKIVLTLTDKNANDKTATQTLDLKVVELKD
jgi:hypothetical protein